MAKANKIKCGFTLSPDVHKDIEDYDEKYEFGNLSLSLERMLLERRNLIEKVELLEKLMQAGASIEKKPEVVEKIVEKEPSIFESLYRDMPD